MKTKSDIPYKITKISLRIFIGIVFVAFSWNKIIDPFLFSKQIHNYELLPIWAENPLAIVLPWMELAAGVMLIFGLWVRQAALLVISMMVVFITASIWAMSKGLDISCGCFLNLGEKVTIEHVAHQISFFLISCVIYFHVSRSEMIVEKIAKANAYD